MDGEQKLLVDESLVALSFLRQLVHHQGRVGHVFNVLLDATALYLASFSGKASVLNVIRYQDYFGSKVIQVFLVPLTGDPDRSIISVIRRFAGLSFDKSVTMVFVDKQVKVFGGICQESVY